jgi:hypothetical protein
MNTTHHSKAQLLIAAFGVAAAAAVAPAVLFAGAGTAQADDGCYGLLQGSYYCSPGASSQAPEQLGPSYTPVQPAFGYNNLPQCSGGSFAAISGALSGEGCS